MMDIGDIDHRSSNHSSNLIEEKSLANDSMVLDSNLVQKDGIKSDENKVLYDIFTKKYSSAKIGSGHSNISEQNNDVIDKQIMSKDGSIVQLESTKKEAEKTDNKLSKNPYENGKLNAIDVKNTNKSPKKCYRDSSGNLTPPPKRTVSKSIYLKEKAEKSEVYSSENNCLSGTVINNGNNGQTCPNIRVKNNSDESKNVVEGSNRSFVNFQEQERSESGKNSKSYAGANDSAPKNANGSVKNTPEAKNGRGKNINTSNGSHGSQIKLSEQERNESGNNSRNDDNVKDPASKCNDATTGNATTAKNGRGKNNKMVDGSNSFQTTGSEEERRNSGSNAKSYAHFSDSKPRNNDGPVKNVPEAKNGCGKNVDSSNGSHGSQIKLSEQERNESGNNSRNDDDMNDSASNSNATTTCNTTEVKIGRGKNNNMVDGSNDFQTTGSEEERSNSGENSRNSDSTSENTANQGGVDVDNTEHAEKTDELLPMELDDGSNNDADAGNTNLNQKQGNDNNINNNNNNKGSSDSDTVMEDVEAKDGCNSGNKTCETSKNEASDADVSDAMITESTPDTNYDSIANNGKETTVDSVVIELNSDGSMYKDVDGQWKPTAHHRPGIGSGGMTSDYGTLEVTEYQNGFSVKNKSNDNTNRPSWNDMDKEEETAYIKTPNKHKSDKASATNTNNNFYRLLDCDSDEEEDKESETVEEGDAKDNDESPESHSSEASDNTTDATDDGAWKLVVNGKAMEPSQLTDSSKHRGRKSYQDANKKFDSAKLTQEGKTILSRTNVTTKFPPTNNVGLTKQGNVRTPNNKHRSKVSKSTAKIMEQHREEVSKMRTVKESVKETTHDNMQTLTLKHRVGTKKYKTQNKEKQSAINDIMEALIKLGNNRFLIHSRDDPYKMISNHKQWLAAKNNLNMYYREYTKEINGTTSKTLKFQVTLKGSLSALELKKEVLQLLIQHHIRMEGEIMSNDVKKLAWLLSAPPDFVNPKPIQDEINKWIEEAGFDDRVVVRRGTVNQNHRKNHARTQALVVHCKQGGYKNIIKVITPHKFIMKYKLVHIHPTNNKGRKRACEYIHQHNAILNKVGIIELCDINQDMLDWEVSDEETLRDAIKECKGIIDIQVNTQNENNQLVAVKKSKLCEMHAKLVDILEYFEGYTRTNNEAARMAAFYFWNPHVAHHYMLDQMAINNSFSWTYAGNERAVSSEADADGDGEASELDSDDDSSVASSATNVTKTYASATSRRSRSRSRRSSKSKPSDDIRFGEGNSRSSSPESTVTMVSVVESLAALQEQFEMMQAQAAADKQERLAKEESLELQLVQMQEQHNREIEEKERAHKKQLAAIATRLQNDINNNSNRHHAMMREDRQTNYDAFEKMMEQQVALRQQNEELRQMMGMLMLRLPAPNSTTVNVPNQIDIPPTFSPPVAHNAATPIQQNTAVASIANETGSVGARRNLTSAFDQSTNSITASDGDPAQRKRESQGGVSPLDTDRKQLKSENRPNV